MTQYLYSNGWKKFFTWFDYLVWYPLGRPVGTTIYPGMQFTAVWIKDFVLQEWSLNDICCYIPAWFGVMATFMTGCLAYECSIPGNTQSNLLNYLMDIVKGHRQPVVHPPDKNVLGLHSPATECALFAMAMMAIVPAHLMRSVSML
jgi:dolichyl-diphosphooligosaccharide--protein glycosyltransferase